MGHASRLTKLLEEQGERQGCWFVDLFVRVDNWPALDLYRKLGYVFGVAAIRGSYSDTTNVG
jgi:N-terminal acetyltransferase B complex catalytic subunit